jgi:hypothetical protein
MGMAGMVLPPEPVSPAPRLRIQPAPLEELERTPSAEASHARWWRQAADALWPAWQTLGRWEQTAVGEVGPEFGELLLLLWSIHRFTGSDEGVAVFDQIVDEDFHLTFADPVTVDAVEVAFALGAAWAESRAQVGPPALVVHAFPARRRRTPSSSS